MNIAVWIYLAVVATAWLLIASWRAHRRRNQPRFGTADAYEGNLDVPVAAGIGLDRRHHGHGGWRHDNGRPVGTGNAGHHVHGGHGGHGGFPGGHSAGGGHH